jgi:DNA-binding response OmpR family regulator
MGSRAREVLLLLVERAGEVVQKRELIAQVCPDTVVKEGALRFHIAAVRKAFRWGETCGSESTSALHCARHADHKPGGQELVAELS